MIGPSKINNGGNTFTLFANTFANTEQLWRKSVENLSVV